MFYITYFVLFYIPKCYKVCPKYMYQLIKHLFYIHRSYKRIELYN